MVLTSNYCSTRNCFNTYIYKAERNKCTMNALLVVLRVPTQQGSVYVKLCL